MLKKTISYTDFNGDPQVEDFYFNLTKAELAEMQISSVNSDNEGGFAAMLQRIVDSKDGKLIISTFKDIVAKSYGVRSEDGKRFIKSDQLSEEFEQTAAYSEFFIEIVTDAKAAAAFINAVVPSDISLTEKEKELLGQGTEKIADISSLIRERNEAQMQGHKPKLEKAQSDHKEVTSQKSLDEMSHEELLALAERAKERGGL